MNDPSGIHTVSSSNGALSTIAMASPPYSSLGRVKLGRRRARTTPRANLQDAVYESFSIVEAARRHKLPGAVRQASRGADGKARGAHWPARTTNRSYVDAGA